MSKKDTWKLEINSNMLVSTTWEKNCKVSNAERSLEEIRIESRDIEIIKKQNISSKLIDFFVEKHRHF